jgi:fatty acid synthase subunit alpha
MDTGTASLCDLEPIMADLSGGLSAFINLKPVLQQIQDRIDSKSDMKKSIYKEHLREGDESSAAPMSRIPLQKKATIGLEKTSFPEYREIQSLASNLEGMVDLERVVVVVGFGEVGKFHSCFTLPTIRFCN